ncbi:hypothetical protein B0H11DRAFT_2233519 [Mycena galericulata]|nr:hypothetical protein B0H11DRAFT_2233519 [Mycena galericulata]
MPISSSGALSSLPPALPCHPLFRSALLRSAALFELALLRARIPPGKNQDERCADESLASKMHRCSRSLASMHPELDIKPRTPPSCELIAHVRLRLENLARAVWNPANLRAKLPKSFLDSFNIEISPSCKGVLRSHLDAPPRSSHTAITTESKCRGRMSASRHAEFRYCSSLPLLLSSNAKAHILQNHAPRMPRARTFASPSRSPQSVAPSVTGIKTFALVSATVRTHWIAYLVCILREDLAPCRAWPREGIGTRRWIC